MGQPLTEKLPLDITKAAASLSQFDLSGIKAEYTDNMNLFANEHGSAIQNLDLGSSDESLNVTFDAFLQLNKGKTIHFYVWENGNVIHQGLKTDPVTFKTEYTNTVKYYV